jgi:hypothetical protein
MGYLPDRKTTTIFVTASTISLKGRKRKIIVETRPEFAIVHLHGSKERYPLAWETIFEAALTRDKRNRKLEGRTGVLPSSEFQAVSTVVRPK